MDKGKNRHAAGAPQISFETFCQGQLFCLALCFLVISLAWQPSLPCVWSSCCPQICLAPPATAALPARLSTPCLPTSHQSSQPCFRLQHDQPQPSTFAIILLLQGFNYSGVNLVKYLIESVYPRCLTFILACSHATAVTGKRHSLVIGTIFVVFCCTSLCDVCHKFMLIY